MSQFSMNSIPIIDNNAMGGFRAGLDTMRAMDHSNSNLASEDLLRQKTEEELTTTRLKRPLDAVEQALKIAEAEKLKGEIDSGQWDEDRRVKRDTEKANLTAKLNDNQMKQLEQRLSGMQAAGQIFGEDANPGNMALNWEAARSEAKQYGFDLGEYNEQNAAKFLRMKQSTPMAMKLYENQIKERQRLEADLIKEGAQANYKSSEAQRHESWQGGQNDATRRNNLAVAQTYASRTGGGGSGGAANTMTKLEAQAINDVDAWMEGKSKQVPSETDLTIYENKLINKRIDNKAFEMLERLGMLQAYTSGDPTARAKLQQLRTEAAMSDPVVANFRAVRAKAAAARGGGSVTPSAPSSAGTSSPSSGWGKVTKE